MKLFKIIVLALAACLIALTIVIAISYINDEAPGLQDLLGFGGIFMAGTILCVPLLYLPTLFILKKISPGNHMFGFTPSIVLIANLPVYFIISALNPADTGRGESVLFLIGFFIIAGVFGAGYVMLHKESTS